MAGSTGKTQQFTYDNFNIDGGANLEIWDSLDSSWKKFGRISGFEFNQDSEHIQQFNREYGIRRESRRKLVGESHRISFMCMEDLNPHITKLIFGSAADDQTVENNQTVRLNKEQVTLYGTQKRILTHPHGLATSARLPAPTLSSAAAASGGSLTDATAYYFWAMAAWGTEPSKPPTSAEVANIDKTWIFGPPSASVTATTASPNLTIGFTLAAPTTGPTPDFYVIVINDTEDDITTGSFLTWVAAPGAVTVTADASTETYEVPNYFYVEEITGYSKSTGSSVTAKLPTTDVVVDLATGKYNRTSGGAWTNNAPGHIYTWEIRNPSVTTKVGTGGTVEDYKKVRISCVEGDDSIKSVAMAEGDELVFFRVNFAGIPGNKSYNEEDFHEGNSVELECAYDATNDGVGTITANSDVFDAYLETFG